MTTPAQYAKALRSLVEEHPRKGAGYLKRLREALQRRGHEKLLPRIFNEYQKLELKRQRSERYAQVSPAAERTRILLELYRTLIQNNG